MNVLPCFDEGSTPSARAKTRGRQGRRVAGRVGRWWHPVPRHSAAAGGGIVRAGYGWCGARAARHSFDAYMAMGGDSDLSLSHDGCWVESALRAGGWGSGFIPRSPPSSPPPLCGVSFDGEGRSALCRSPHVQPKGSAPPPSTTTTTNNAGPLGRSPWSKVTPVDPKQPTGCVTAFHGASATLIWGDDEPGKRCRAANASAGRNRATGRSGLELLGRWGWRDAARCDAMGCDGIGGVG